MKADSVRDAAMLWHGSTRPPSLVRGCCRFVEKEAPKQGTARDEIGLDRKSLRFKRWHMPQGQCRAAHFGELGGKSDFYRHDAEWSYFSLTSGRSGQARFGWNFCYSWTEGE
jgi:hypothetical protein